MSTTIRRNAFKKIESILRTAVLIREYKYDDMGDTTGVVSVERVLDVGREFEFDKVYESEGVLRCGVHMNWSFIAYQSVEAARRSLTPQAFAKYFPAVA